MMMINSKFELPVLISTDRSETKNRSQILPCTQKNAHAGTRPDALVFEGMPSDTGPAQLSPSEPSKGPIFYFNVQLSTEIFYDFLIEDQ